MTNEENKDLEKVSDVSSLNALCLRRTNLTALQKLAMKQRIAFRFERMKNSYMYNCDKASLAFATYITLLESKPDVFGNVCDILTEFFVSEEIVEECLMYIRTGIIPYNIWIDKLLVDLKGSSFYNKASIGGMLTVYLGKTLKTSLIAFNKVVKALEENEHILDEDCITGIQFVKSRYLEIPQEMKEEYMTAHSTSSERMRRLFQDNESSIFSETLVDMLRCPFNHAMIEDIDKGVEISPFKDFWVCITDNSPLVNNAVGEGGLATEVSSENADQEELHGMGSWWAMLGYGPEGQTKEEYARMVEHERRNAEIATKQIDMAEETAEDEVDIEISNEQNIKYLVQKVAKDGSNRVVFKKWFDTEDQANKFIKDVKESNAEMTRKFDFTITPGIKE